MTSELKALDREVASNGALADIKGTWKTRPPGDLRSALRRMVEETDRDTVKGYVLEAIGFNAPTKDWAFVSRENAARAVLAESLRSVAEGKETALHPITLFGKYTVGPRKALENAVATADCDVVKAIAAITDICSALFKIDEAFISVKPDQQKTTSPSGVEKIEDIRDDESGTMLETPASTRYARSHGMLVDVGPSCTIGRLLRLGVEAGASDREQVAVALALFAFWNVHYWRAASGIHHFHYVMDMLQNFVPGKYKYTGYPAHISEIYDFDNVKVGADAKEKDVLT